MGRLFEGFEILCTDYDHILKKRGYSIQGRTLFKEFPDDFAQNLPLCTRLSIRAMEKK